MIRKHLYHIKIRFLQNKPLLFKRLLYIRILIYRINYRLGLSKEIRDYQPYHLGCDLIVEGFPRSANTFTVNAIKKSQNEKIIISHHSHMASSLIYGVNNGIPSILLLRKPLEAITSAFIRSPWLGLRILFIHYIHFHKNLLKYKQDLIIGRFEKITTSFEGINQLIISANHQAKKNYHLINFDLDQSEIFEEIETMNRLKYGKAAVNEDMVARPSMLREVKKENVLRQILENKKYRKLLHKCDVLYNQFHDEA